MRLLLDLVIYTIAVIIVAYLLPGVHLSLESSSGINDPNFYPDLMTALATALILGLINTFLRPILIFITLPLTILTLGLFILVINTLLVLLASAIVPGFAVDGFWWALLFGIVLWLVNSVLQVVESRLLGTP
jgi:putative membrane protein